MKRRYEGLLVLNAHGTEDSVREIIDRLESEFKKEGADVEMVQKMDKRQFSYVSGPLEAGYYVNFVFRAEPDVVPKLRAKFKLDAEVYRQDYSRLPEQKEREESKKVSRKKLAKTE